MPIKDYTTKINPSKTAGEVMELLAQRGAQRIALEYDHEIGIPVALVFAVNTEYGVRQFDLPIRAAGVLKALERDPKVPRALVNEPQANRVAWRITKDWIEAQMALIEAGLASLDEVMLPYMVDSGGKTVFEVYRTQQFALEAGETHGKK